MAKYISLDLTREEMLLILESLEYWREDTQIFFGHENWLSEVEDLEDFLTDCIRKYDKGISYERRIPIR